ncbi:MAG: TRAP transporter large permease [Spirochaetales bacterium]|jgi:tripartite ATP-independent transporter DctM subunit|nr:TRAP transporter large permease [Spirochaetales bacterium]
MLLPAIVFVVLMIIGVPIAFVLGLMGTVHTILLGNPNFLLVTVQRLFDQINLASLTCLPFFILAGEVMNAGGVTKRLLGFIREVAGILKGGMAYSCVLIAALLSAILGSPNGVASMLCGVLVPELRKDGYPEEFTGSLVAASAILGPIIPPSTSYIMYCMLTNTSIKAMFVGGIVPGILLVFVFCSLISYFAAKLKFRRSIDSLSLRRIGKNFIIAFPALLVPGIIIGGVIGGFFTATEAGAVSCLCAFIASAIYREIDWHKIPGILLRSAMTGGGILLMISFGGVISWSLTRSGIPRQLIQFVMGITTSKDLVIALIIVILMIGGCLLDTGTMQMVFNPVMFPLAMAIGMDPVHFGIVFCVLLCIGYMTPPVGVVLFVTSNAAGIPFSKLCKLVWPFAIGAFVVISVLAYLPDLVLWLPRLTGYAG